MGILLPWHLPLLTNVIRSELFIAIQHFSREERLSTYQQLELQIFRSGSSFVLDLLRAQVWIMMWYDEMRE